MGGGEEEGQTVERIGVKKRRGDRGEGREKMAEEEKEGDRGKERTGK